MAGQVYRSHSDQIIDLLSRQGDIAAGGALRSGNIWANEAANLGQQASNAYTAYEKDQTANKVGRVTADILSKANTDPNFDITGALKQSGLDPKEYGSVISAYNAANQAESMVQERKARIADLQAKQQQEQQMLQQQSIDAGATLAYHAAQHLGEDGGLTALNQAAGFIKARQVPIPGMDKAAQTLDQLNQEWQAAKASGDPNAIAAAVQKNTQFATGIRDQLMGAASQDWRDKTTKEEQGKIVNVAEGTKVMRLPGLGESGPPTTIAAGEPKPKTLETQLGEAYSAGDTAKVNDILKLMHNKAEQTHITISTGDENNVKDAIALMKEGKAPPLLPGRASKEYVAMIGEAKRQGFDLAKANEDWTATAAHLKTLNGAQQTRMRQAVDTAIHSLDVIDDLAKQWQGGKYPLLNKATLAAAKSGALGAKAASLATRLDAQIGDVTSEIANAYMGGNSPTDHALQLAAKNLSSDWQMSVLLDATKLARENLQIRSNSMNNVNAVTQGGDNMYAPHAAPAAASPAIGAPGSKYEIAQ